MEEMQEWTERVCDVFRSAYRRNCHLDDCSMGQDDELALAELSPAQAITCLQELLDRLLTEKQELRKEETFELRTRCEQFERMLQKLESEVRAHIRVEQQLKLQIEATQEKLDAAQRLADTYLPHESTLNLSEDAKASPILVEALIREEPTRESRHHRFPSADFAPVLDKHKGGKQGKYGKELEDLKRTEGEKGKAEWEKTLRASKGAKESVGRKMGVERPTQRNKVVRAGGEDKGLTERVFSQRLSSDRKPTFSPYKLSAASRSSSKMRLLDPALLDIRVKSHVRHLSDGKKSRFIV